MAQPNGNSHKLSIPLIDLAPLTSSNLSERKTCANAILSAFSNYGFCYLTSPPNISPSTISTVFQHSASFFARPQHEKDSLAWTTPQANRGYVTAGREKTSHALTAEEVLRERQNAGGDLKESMEIGRDDDADHPNHWPPHDTSFRSVMSDFYTRCATLHQLIMSAIALGLGLDEHFFDPMLQQQDNNLRLLHYPPVAPELFRRNAGQVRAGAHTDYGSVTLLWQDERGGLQVQPEGEGGAWVDVTPVPGALVVNAGDLLARWSNERVRSTRHRVVEPPGKKGDGHDGDAEVYPARYSVVYFCNPDYTANIEALPNTYGGEFGDRKFPPVLAGDYLVSRLAATY